MVAAQAQGLDFSVDWNVLFARMHKNLNRYWRRFTYDPRRIAWMYRDDGYSWAVLGVLRQFYSFREGTITSKAGAGAYALEHLPSRWHPLIQEALNIRSGLPGSLYASQLQRTLEAIRFLREIIRRCNAGFAQTA